MEPRGRGGWVVGTGGVDRVRCHTCGGEKGCCERKTHPKESLLKADDDEREKR